MGRHSQYQKRGAATGTSIILTAPPSPTLHVVAGLLLQEANGTDDTGGILSLEISTDEGSTWEPYDLHSWLSTWPWGAITFLDPGLYRGTETGNGSTYIGQSPPSNTVEVP